MSITEINERFARIDRVWQLEYQRGEDDLRYRVVEADFLITFDAVKHTLIDLGYPIQNDSILNGVLVGTSNAPTPLTKEEWAEVVRKETPRVKEIGGWMFNMKDDPSDYI